MPQRIQRITNANVLVDGNNLWGSAEEVKLPDVKSVMAEFKALGNVGKIELFSGFDKMECTIKWNSIFADISVLMADFTKTRNIQVRGNIDVYSGSTRTGQQPIVTYLRGTPKQFPLGNFKPHDNVEGETQLNITYIKQEINGRETVELDVMNNIYKVDGVDLLAQYRANLGI